MREERLAGWFQQWFGPRSRPGKENGDMDRESTKDLTFVPTLQLVEELKKRHDALIVCGVRFTDVKGAYKVLRVHNGHRFVCLSLLSNMESIINSIENANLKQCDD